VSNQYRERAAEVCGCDNHEGKYHKGSHCAVDAIAALCSQVERETLEEAAKIAEGLGLEWRKTIGSKKTARERMAKEIAAEIRAASREGEYDV
jgi:hypothetical protein